LPLQEAGLPFEGADSAAEVVATMMERFASGLDLILDGLAAALR